MYESFVFNICYTTEEKQFGQVLGRKTIAHIRIMDFHHKKPLTHNNNLEISYDDGKFTM